MNKFEEYKLFVEDTAKFSERRQTVNNTYVAVNSILLSAVSFLVKDAGFEGPWQATAVILTLDEKGHVIKGKGLNFLDREIWLPNIFLTVYMIFLTGAAYALFFAPHLFNATEAAR